MTGRLTVRGSAQDRASQLSGSIEVGGADAPHRSVASSAVQHEVEAPKHSGVLLPTAGRGERSGSLLLKPATGFGALPAIDPSRLPTDPVQGAILGAHAGRWNRPGALFITAKQVDVALASGDLRALDPMLPQALWPLVQSLAVALTPEGALGSRGPLSSRGPVGNHAWNPSEVLRAAGDWRSAAQMMTAFGGPGSELGPLGSFGAGAAWAKAMLPLLGPIAAQLEAGKMFGVLGPNGPLGPEGPLGFLGRTGGHGFAQNDRGEFVSARGVERNTSVRYLGDKRDFGLVELYREVDHAKVEKQDASWIVDGHIEASDRDGDSFKFRVKKGELLTLTVVPERVGDIFALELFDRRGRVVARSDSDRLVNFIQAKAPVGGELTARVTVKSRGPEKESLAASPITAWIDALLAPIFGSEINRRPSGAYRLVAT